MSGGYSQDSMAVHQRIKEQLYWGSHFDFTVIPLITQKGKIQPQSGPYIIGTRPVRGIEAGFNYHRHMEDDYSFIMGLHGGASFRNYSLFIAKEDFTPNGDEDFIVNTKSSRSADLYLSVPMLYEKRWFTGTRNHWHAQLGINVRFYPDQFKESIYHAVQSGPGSYYNVLVLEFEVGRNYKPWADYNVAGGYSWLLQNGNLIRSGLLINFSNKSISQGTYLIQIPGQPDSKGIYTSSHSFVGLSFSYILTVATRRALKN